MTEGEMLSFLLDVHGILGEFYSFCLANHVQHPEVSALAYDVVLWQKNLVSAGLQEAAGSIVYNRWPGSRPACTQAFCRTQCNCPSFTKRSNGPPQMPELQRRLDEDECELSARVTTTDLIDTGSVEKLKLAASRRCSRRDCGLRI